jgi:hypothetical protein
MCDVSPGRQTVPIRINVSEQPANSIRHAARQDGRTVSDYVKHLLIGHLERQQRLSEVDPEQSRERIRRKSRAARRGVERQERQL